MTDVTSASEPVYLEDIPEGAVMRSRGRTIDQSDIQTFAGLSGDFDVLHTDEEWARREGPFGARIAHGLLVTSIITGFTGAWSNWAYMAFLGLDRSFRGPVFPGDTVHAEVEVVEKRPSSSKPDRGIVVTNVRVLNQRGEVVQEGVDRHMVFTRAAVGA